MRKSCGGKQSRRHRGLGAPKAQVSPKVQVPVSYNKGGRQVKANGTRFSPKGCVIYTKNPHTCGTAFSLKITNPQSNKSIQVDSSVVLRKRFDGAKKWGMVVRFINVSEGEKDKIRQILSQAAAIPESASDSKYLKTPIGQAILRYFNLKKLMD